MTDPIDLTIRLDIDKVLAPTHRGYDEDGEPYGAEPRTLEEVVLDLATEHLIAKLDADTKRGLAERVRQIRDEVIRAAVEPIVTEALAGPIQQTNTYGEPIGKETTLREIIVATAQKALVLQPPGNRRGYDLPAATKVMVEEVDRAVQAEVKAIVAAVKAETADAIRVAAADAIAKAAS